MMCASHVTMSCDCHVTVLTIHMSCDQRAAEEEEEEPPELLSKPREYKVKFSFPNPPPLNPPILGAYGEWERVRGEGEEEEEGGGMCFVDGFSVCRCDILLRRSAKSL